MIYRHAVKRPLDIAVSTILLVFLSPFFALIAVAILIDDGKPVIFRQVRVGRGGRRFVILKYRSMERHTPELQSSDATTVRVTKVGRALRRTSLDELPQLVNVMRGDMSLVGPRPPLPSQDDVLAARAATHALSVRPGLTGLAQVNSYEGMPPSIKVEFDATYAANVSFRMDLSILALTIRYLMRPPPSY